MTNTDLRRIHKMQNMYMMSSSFRLYVYERAHKDVLSMPELYAYYMNVLTLTECIINPILIDEEGELAYAGFREFAKETLLTDFPEDSFIDPNSVNQKDFDNYYIDAIIVGMETINNLWYKNR